jgi:amino acid adenylation domain-containing protein
MGFSKDIVDFLLEARQEGVFTSLENDTLSFKVLKGKIVRPELVAELKDRKEEILSFLKKDQMNNETLVSEKNKISPFDRTTTGHIPLSYAQESAWIDDKLKGSALHRVPVVLRFGGVDIAALSFALEEMVKRHEIFRTLYKEKDGIPYQEIVADTHFKLKYTKELTAEKDLGYYLKEEADALFNLSIDFSFRAHLIQVANFDFVLILVFHHIATDAISEKIFSSEVMELYKAKIEGRTPMLPPLKLQYADYAVWQRNYIQGEVLEDKLSYWKNKLEGHTLLKLPTDFDRPRVQGVKGDSVGKYLGKELSDKIRTYLRTEKVTPYMFFLTAINVLFNKLSGEEDICIGTPVSGRNHKEVEAIIGYFVNSIPLRNDLSGDPKFKDLLRQVKHTVLEAYDHQDVPFEKILNNVDAGRERNSNSIYNVVFNFLGLDQPQLFSEEEETDTIKLNNAEFDLLLTVIDDTEQFYFGVNYNSDLFVRSTAERFWTQFQELLNAILTDADQNISKLNVISQEEISRLQSSFNANAQPYPEKETILDLFTKQLAKSPEATAVIFKNRSLSYRELDEKSNQFANYLNKQGIAKGDLLPLLIDRSLEMMIALFGIMKSGAAYIAIPIDFPPARIAQVLSTLPSKLIVCDQGFSSKVKQVPGVEALEIDTSWEKINEESKQRELSLFPSPSDLSYVIYTSGSTGEPNAIMTEHGSLTNFLYGMIDVMEVDENSCFLGLAAYSFDGSCMELYLPLLLGGKVIIVPQEAIREGGQLQELIHQHPITHLHATPSGFQLLLNSSWENKGKALLFVGGEPLSKSLKDQLLALGEEQKLWNLYGPTETTLYASCKAMQKGQEKITVGKPLPNYQVYIVDQNNQPVPVGVQGEVLIGGVGVARGYLNSAEKTAQKFIQNPFDKNAKNRLYRTGDLGRWTQDGEIELLGRSDSQVKLRGYRIELNEIEGILAKHSAIKQSTVLITENEQEENRMLVAFVQAHKSINEKELREYLAENLPHYMVPGRIIELKEFPLSRNGKVDKKALLEDHLELHAREEALIMPENAVEEALLSIWKEILQIEEISVLDDFFLLGGNSLLAIRLVTVIKKRFGKDFPVTLLFDYSSIRVLAEKIGTVEANESTSLLMRINGKGEKPPILFAPGVGGNGMEFNSVVRHLEAEQPFFSFIARGLEAKELPFQSIEETAAAYVKEIKQAKLAPPYTIGGYSFGVFTAFEMIYLLEKEGINISNFIVLDAFSPWEKEQTTQVSYDMNYDEWLLFFTRFYNQYYIHYENARFELSLEDFTRVEGKDNKLNVLYSKLKEAGGEYTFDQVKGHIDVYIANSEAMTKYIAGAKRIKAPVTLVKAVAKNDQRVFDKSVVDKFDEFYKEKSDRSDFGWSDFTAGKVAVHELDCRHPELLEEQFATQIAEIIKSKSLVML